MEKQSRRGMLKNAAKMAAVVGGGAVMSGKAQAQAGKAKKIDALAKPGVPKAAQPLPYTDVVRYGDLLFVAGVGCHLKGEIEAQTTWVLDQIEKNLTAAGSSLEKVLKVNVYLQDVKMFDRMNAVYRTRKFGSIFPARTTVQPAFLPGENPSVEIECIAYV